MQQPQRYRNTCSGDTAINTLPFPLRSSSVYTAMTVASCLGQCQRTEITHRTGGDGRDLQRSASPTPMEMASLAYCLLAHLFLMFSCPGKLTLQDFVATPFVFPVFLNPFFLFSLLHIQSHNPHYNFLPHFKVSVIHLYTNVTSSQTGPTLCSRWSKLFGEIILQHTDQFSFIST